MSIRRTATVAAGMMMALALPAAAQRDSSEAHLRTVLRAFYFNLAHHDWEAIAADVLSAKILASRAAPPSLDRPPNLAESVACSTGTPALVDNAVIRLDGDWAAVSIPRCGLALAAADEFRLVRFEKRWRFVSIDLFEARVASDLVRGRPAWPHGD